MDNQNKPSDMDITNNKTGGTNPLRIIKNKSQNSLRERIDTT